MRDLVRHMCGCDGYVCEDEKEWSWEEGGSKLTE